MIEVKNLSKYYGEHKAIDDLSFNIERRKVYGFLGPNGAGKSTTMNIITGCLAASSGQVFINGFDIFENPIEAKRCIGYLPEVPPLYQDMTVREYLRFVAAAKGISKENMPEELKDIADKTGITEVSPRLIKNLSKGYKQRVGIAQALIGNPEIIILDEPTVGLDPKQIIEIRELIKTLGEEHTVILSSHILTEVRSVCNEIIIISKGKIVANDTPENLEKLFSTTATLELTVKASTDEVLKILDSPENLKDMRCISDPANEQYTRITLSFEKQQELAVRENIFSLFSAANKPIIEMNSSETNLEEVFLGLTEEGDKDASNLS